jgi:hypothetical protein
MKTSNPIINYLSWALAGARKNIHYIWDFNKLGNIKLGFNCRIKKL